MTPIEQAKSMLPNVPEEVFNMFLVPLIESEGWPFRSNNDMAASPWSIWLGTQFLKEFTNLLWNRNTLLLKENVLHPSSHMDIISLIGAVFYNARTPPGYDIGKAKMRVHSHIEIVRRTGKLCSPLVITHTSAGFRILDGHHRMAALFSLSLHHQITVDAWIGQSTSNT